MAENQLILEDNIENVGLGNTKPIQQKSKKKTTRSRCWVFTLNNYTNKEYEDILKAFNAKNGCEYIVGKEIGKKNNVKHLQGYVNLRSAMSFSAIKKLMPNAHIEKARGNKQKNFDYCSKDGNYETNMKLKNIKNVREILKNLCLKEYEGVVWKTWQQKVLDILSNKPDKRKIHWFWEETGNVGKSFIAKYICLTMEVIIADGKKSNIFNQVNQSILEGKIPEIILLDVPRSNKKFVNYGMLEQLKEGFVYSGKYEGGKCIFPKPHLIIFANSEPELLEMSLDRWDIYEIGAEKIIAKEIINNIIENIFEDTDELSKLLK